MINFIKSLIAKFRANKETINAAVGNIAPVQETKVYYTTTVEPVTCETIKVATNAPKGNSSKNYRKRGKARSKNSTINN